MRYDVILSKIGLSENESKIYYDLLENGASLIIDISNRTKIHRPIIYKLLPSLIEMNLVGEILIGKRKRYKAENPNHLQSLFDNLSKSFNYLLPELSDIYNKNTAGPNIKVITGKNAIVGVYDDIVACLDNFGEYYRYSSRTDDLGKDFSNYKTQIAKKNITRYVITSFERKNSKGKKSGREMVCIPKNYDLFDDNISKIIYKNKVAIIDYNTLTAFIIENALFAGFEKKIFMLLFSMLKDKYGSV